MNARDIMTDDPTHADVDATLDEVEAILFEMDFRHIPVTRDGSLVGMLSDRDLREYGVDELSTTTAGEAMQGGVIMAHPETELAELLDILLEHRVGAVPIVDPIEQELVGIVSYVDVLRVFRDDFLE